MVIFLRAVVRDGTDPISLNINDLRQPLRFPLAANLTINLSVENSSGVPVDITSGVITMTVRKNLSDYTAVLVKVAQLVGRDTRRGKATIDFASIDTDALTPGTYFYDLVRTSGLPGAAREVLIQVSPLYLESAGSR
jgi:hypothetical protein